MRQKIYFLAGGTDLYVLKKDGRLADDPVFADISRLEELKGIREEEEYISIGPLTTFSQIRSSSLLCLYAPALVEAASQVGSPQIRNRATIGGNVCNASPAGDSIPALYVHKAVFNLCRGNRTRNVPVEDFFRGPGSTILENGELLTRITIPRPVPLKGAFRKLGPRKALAITKVSVAVSGRVENRRIKRAGVALGAVGPTVIRARRTEDALEGNLLTRAVIDLACGVCEKECSPIDDFRSTASYRKKMVGALLRSALEALR